TFLTTSSLILGMRKQSLRKIPPAHRKTNRSPHSKEAVAAQTQNLATALQQHLDKLPTDQLARSSGFRRRKPKKLTPSLFLQAASPDVLPLLQPGDLIIRDLGYFVLEVLEPIVAAKAYFLSRLRLGVSIWESDGCTPVNLWARLRKAGFLDIQCTLGDKRVPV